MPRSGKKPKRAGKADKRQPKEKKPTSAGKTKVAKPLDFEGLKHANDVSARCGVRAWASAAAVAADTAFLRLVGVLAASC